MVEHSEEDLSGSSFEDLLMLNSRFHMVDFTGSAFDHVRLKDMRIRGELVNVEIEADVDNLRINGVDVGTIIEAELNRRYPERGVIFGARTPDEIRVAWATVQTLWEPTVERMRSLPAATLNERVNGEWSSIQTLRHLVFATDAWILRTLLGRSSPFHPLGLPYEQMPDTPGVPRDHDAQPSLEAILEVRADRMRVMTDVVTELTEVRLEAMTEPVAEPGYPESEAFPVRRCISCILCEEWEHHQFLTRDLDILATR
jgi:hypothetical protein